MGKLCLASIDPSVDRFAKDVGCGYRTIIAEQHEYKQAFGE